MSPPGITEFKRVLIANQIITGVILMGYALFNIGTPHVLIIATLLFGGFFRSLQFTAINTLAYAEIDPARMSRARSVAWRGDVCLPLQWSVCSPPLLRRRVPAWVSAVRPK